MRLRNNSHHRPNVLTGISVKTESEELASFLLLDHSFLTVDTGYLMTGYSYHVRMMPAEDSQVRIHRPVDTIVARPWSSIW